VPAHDYHTGPGRIRKAALGMTTTLLKTSDSRNLEASRRCGGKYLTFKLGQEEYGLEILKVREINGLMDITAVPQMPTYMKGVINLRGTVIPVVDLRLKFGLPEVKHTEQTCIIVVNVGREIGIIVDTVSEVLDIPDSSIEPPPEMGARGEASCILGMGKVSATVKILLDIEQVLSVRELEGLPKSEEVEKSSAKPKEVLPTF
jgi:purine-binding chemotaxis protein CheW